MGSAPSFGQVDPMLRGSAPAPEFGQVDTMLGGSGSRVFSGSKKYRCEFFVIRLM